MSRIRDQVDKQIDYQLKVKPHDKIINVKAKPADISGFAYKVAGRYYYRGMEIVLI